MAKFVKQDDDDGNQKNKNLYKDFFFHKEIKAQQARELADEDIEILSNVEDIIPYLQTALLEEHLIEVDIGQLTRDFFTQITDDEPNGNGIDTGQESLRLAGDQETGGLSEEQRLFPDLATVSRNGKCQYSSLQISYPQVFYRYDFH